MNKTKNQTLEDDHLETEAASIARSLFDRPKKIAHDSALDDYDIQFETSPKKQSANDK